jgi:hypothetical protein
MVNVILPSFVRDILRSSYVGTQVKAGGREDHSAGEGVPDWLPVEQQESWPIKL